MAEKLPEGHETILVVDDQETVWDFLIEALQNLGYSVILAENGLDAIEICRENPEQIDLVLLDMIMPKLGGHSTFYQLRALDPKIKILLASGYVAPSAVNDLLANGAVGFLQKPHRIKTLAAELRRILDADKKSVSSEQKPASPSAEMLEQKSDSKDIPQA